MIAGAVVAFFFCMLAGITAVLVGGEWWRERSAMLGNQIDDALNNPLPPGYLRRR